MVNTDANIAIRKHLKLLGHAGHGVTELRVFKTPTGPMVAYVDNLDDTVRLCVQMDGQTPGVYIGVQPRPLHLFECAPNQWMPAISGATHNCARDMDIECVTTLYFDIDVVSEDRQDHPASDTELRNTLDAARILALSHGLSAHATVCCSGNGHYLLFPIVPILVDAPEIPAQFKSFCGQCVGSVANQTKVAKFDPVFNLSRVMRVMGTVNRKGQAVPGRPYRRAHFVNEPLHERSMELHHRIRNTEFNLPTRVTKPMPSAMRCDLNTLKGCEFIEYCRRSPHSVSEPEWFALITNLVPIEGGDKLIHEISRLDTVRYDYAHTQHTIERVLSMGYRPQSCRSIVDHTVTRPGKSTFQCSQIKSCPARAPVYIANSPHPLFTIGANHE